MPAGNEAGVFGVFLLAHLALVVDVKLKWAQDTIRDGV